MSESGDPALLGRTVAGKFVIESFLGGGAMGAVYKARQPALEKDVAIKVMHAELAQKLGDKRTLTDAIGRLQTIAPDGEELKELRALR